MLISGKKYRLLFLTSGFILPIVSIGQNLTGVWQGFFYSSAPGVYDEYKYEVQINQAANSAIKGVTYSYQNISFYGKADLQGIYMPKTKNLILKETKMIEMRSISNSSPCLMTCYLEYSKAGNTEYLSGTYSSSGLCREGKVYLQRVKDSDFKKEGFLTQRQIAGSDHKSSSATVKNNTKPATTNRSSNQRNSNSAGTNNKNASNNPLSIPNMVLSPEVVPPVENPVKVAPPQQLPVPRVLRERENKLIRTITTSSPDIKIELYDNGEIDGDTISVYHNNKVVVDKKGLTYKAITLNIKADSLSRTNEFVMVANNLGSIPPNTALMVITTGGKRYELTISTDEKRNAKVIIEFKPQ